jgi:undecaprenyl-diphosphatase
MTELAGTPRATASTTIAAVLLFLFAALGVIAHQSATGSAFDHAVLTWMVNHRNPGLTLLAIAVTNVGSPIGTGVIAGAVAAALWWRTGSPRPAVLILATLGLAGAVSTLSKMIVDTHRPAQTAALVIETDPSFPSGHVTGTLALLGALTAVIGHHGGSAAYRAVIMLTAVATVLVGLTRLYLGVHWSTDVIGGLLLGATAAVIAHLAYRRMMGPSDIVGESGAAALSGPAPAVGA